MSVSVLPIGTPVTLTQNIAYVAPPRRVLIHVAGSGMEQSNDNSTWVGVTLDTSENFECAAQFIRSTAVGTIVCCKN